MPDTLAVALTLGDMLTLGVIDCDADCVTLVVCDWLAVALWLDDVV